MSKSATANSIGTEVCSKEASRNELFRSFTMGKLLLKNRFVMAPMTRGFSPEGIPTVEVANYYRRRAEGGVGLIITEGTYVGHPSAAGYPNVPVLDGEKQLAGWKEVVEAVHVAGGKIFPQLWHTGSYCKPDFDRGHLIERWAPSAVAHPGYLNDQEIHMPKRMSQKEIDEMIECYARSARNAMKLGFDGLEIHGAHGYLIDQFFWPLTNKRMDKYGGSLKDRMRFACEVVAAVRAATAPDFPICFRYSNWKLNAFDERGKIFHSPADLYLFLTMLSDSGVDIFHASSRRIEDPLFNNSPLSLAGWTKKLVDKPTITVGSVGLNADFISERMGKTVGRGTLNSLVERMNFENFDLVAVGRALLADPDWVNKVRLREDEQIILYDKSFLSRLY